MTSLQLCSQEVLEDSGKSITLVVHGFQMTLSEDKQPSISQLRQFSKRLVDNLSKEQRSRYCRIELRLILVVDNKAYEQYCKRSLPCTRDPAAHREGNTIKWEVGGGQEKGNGCEVYFAPFALRIPCDQFHRVGEKTP